MFSFENKIVVITGAAGGIPTATAKLFYDLGASLALGDLDVDKITGATAAMDGDRVLCHALDVTSTTSFDSFKAAVMERYGRCDVLVTAAGLYRDRMVAEMTDAEWATMMAVNVDGVFRACRAFGDAMGEGGAIVNIASLAGHKGSREHAHYAAAKGAVLSFSRSLAAELAPRVRVNCVSPGLVDTGFVASLLEKIGTAMEDATPMKRRGEPEDIARAIAFLASDWASFVTGETIHVNGGFSML
ncbi:SDR family NAD(P)-dependent oxidoreductase [Microbaculum marinisediminis]|uniref:SDR family oxidoreductase n=1 Tax=Microbaculum marinisediminis TaxID=2931392 RepID=A0AAW5QUK5_9HYPH|nr:SDR family oxidoreductase [Microbaculum sp. A6E488]MCT8971373.1 SDR family oxidoreductase [Microbaculum sp. A6E488]